jgi:hypothetical protein
LQATRTNGGEKKKQNPVRQAGESLPDTSSSHGSFDLLFRPVYLLLY